MLFNEYCNIQHPKPDSDFSVQSGLIPLTFMNLLWFQKGKSKHATYDAGGKPFKQVLKQDCSLEGQLLDEILDSG